MDNRCFVVNEQDLQDQFTTLKEHGYLQETLTFEEFKTRTLEVWPEGHPDKCRNRPNK